MRIVVQGYMVRGPIGGLAWHHLQYVLGLLRLGHDVRFIEDSDDYPMCYDPTRHVTDTDPSYGLRFAESALRRIGSDNWAYFDAHTSTWFGPGSVTAKDFCRSADVLMNVSGVNPLREWTEKIPRRIYIDTDPVFTQVRHIRNAGARERASQHNAFFTFAENVERGTAMLPDDGFPWRATRQPVVLDEWRVTEPPANAPYTTVMQWQSYAPVEYEGKKYGMKADSFENIVDLPRISHLPLELALGGADAPREILLKKGWRVADPLEIARKPQDFQEYIRRSRGEVAVAKHGYVLSNSGWFSERSAGYLASGRPVVTQDTGFSDFLPVGDGLFSFRSTEDAANALEVIESDYRAHSCKARDVAGTFFESARVLRQLLHS